uniref:Uncharacterized protein n=1 Tax=Arundo donax TaxID=35708 RepID=A0A0A9GGL6_ARUDO
MYSAFQVSYSIQTMTISDKDMKCLRRFT